MRVLSVASVLFVSLACALGGGCDGGPSTDTGDQDVIQDDGPVVDVATDIGNAEAGEGFDAAADVAMDIGEVVDPADMDGDGYRAESSFHGNDCNDNDPNIHPGATEYCDGIDSNCDGLADQAADGGTDPIADMGCDIASYMRQFDGGFPPFVTDSPARCYTIPTNPSAPCQATSGALGAFCQGCYHDVSIPMHCWSWTNIPGQYSGGQCR